MPIIGEVTYEELGILKAYIKTESFQEDYETFLKHICPVGTIATKTLLQLKLQELRDGARIVKECA